MRKIIYSLCLGIVFFLPQISHADTITQIEDDARLFGTGITQLKEKAKALSTETKASVFIVTTEDNEDDTETAAKQYLKDKIGKGQNGIVCYIDMNQREVYIWSTGKLHNYITEDRIEQILDDVQPNLSDEQYVQAANAFLKDVSKFYKKGIPKSPSNNYSGEETSGDGEETSGDFDETTEDVPVEKGMTPQKFIIVLVIALGCPITFWAVTVGRYQLKIGVWHYPFRQNCDLELTQDQDILVDSWITTRHIPSSNDNNFGGGGGGGDFGSGSGGGRSF